ncbi:hypothetical protein FE697_016210 [Mumia zhuanghuii]|uniref:Uncharacterized protein n=1 Tax=Mumia zhuanghuii TaxID=2585211 RepID=A0A5Q6RR34_9ACTN|nr:hypothetical protein FE697_016210 [Mumia zhuanghuii]
MTVAPGIADAPATSPKFFVAFTILPLTENRNSPLTDAAGPPFLGPLSKVYLMVTRWPGLGSRSSNVIEWSD